MQCKINVQCNLFELEHRYGGGVMVIYQISNNMILSEEDNLLSNYCVQIVIGELPKLNYIVKTPFSDSNRK